MEIIAITCIHNESDIIETFIRVNSSFIDLFVIVDDSKDGSLDILNAMTAEGFRILVLRRNVSEVYRQDIAVTSVLRYLQENGITAEYYIPLDSDEFPVFSSKSEALDSFRTLSPGVVGALRWETYVPTSVDFSQSILNGLQNNFRARSHEGTQYEKIVIPAALVSDVYVGVGSHHAFGPGGRRYVHQTLQSRLAHFPIRSPEQILRKNLRAVYWLIRKTGRLEGEGLHVYETLAQLKSSNFKVSLPELQQLAMDYANNKSDDRTIAHRPHWVGNYRLEYTHQVGQTAIEEFAEYILNGWLDPPTDDQLSDLRNSIKLG